MKKVLLWILGVLAVLVIAVIIIVNASWDKRFDIPLPEIVASKDSAMIARGKYLAYGPAHCATCHMPEDKIMEVENGLEIPLSGGWTLDIPPGTFRAPNLTPDDETGIGKISDGQIARAIRHSVKFNDKLLFPFMPFQDLTDEDVTAIISFLRSQKPVKNNVKETELSFLGKAIMAFGIVEPVGPTAPPKASIPIEATPEYGEYIAASVANCKGCHTQRDLKTGDFIGPEYAGRFVLPPDKFSKGYAYVSPNLTPDKMTGVLAAWNEETFVNRFKGGRVHETTPMPWGAFSRMNEVEVRAVYRFLNTLDPVPNSVPKTVFKPGEALPEY